MTRLWTIARKELQTTFHSKRTIVITVLLFLGVAIVPAYKIEDIVRDGVVTSKILVHLVDGFLMVALLAPLFVASRVAESAFLAERDRKTLEHLLSMPVSDRDLFLGKFLPGLAVGVLVEAVVSLCMVALVAMRYPEAMAGAGALYPLLLVTLVALGPIFIALSVLAVLLLSLRLASTREASMGSLLVIFMPVLLYMLKFTRVVDVDPLAFNLGLSLVLGVVVVFMTLVGMGSFNRERLVAAA